MRGLRSRIVSTLTVLFACACGPLPAGDWLHFRGTRSDGVGAEKNLPIEWSVEKNAERNVAWRVPLPGRGVSSPIVVGGRVIVTSSDGHRQDRLHVLSFDRESGRKQWERRFWATGPTFSHPKTCAAAPTPASDGRRIFAFFGSNDLFCLDLEGNLLWLRGLTHDYPNASNSVGMASSPLVVAGTVVVQVENDTNSFAAGLDVHTGLNHWKIARPERVNWTSPVALGGESGSRRLVLQSREGLAGYNARTGEQLWKFPTECAVIPSCAVSDGVIVVPSHGLVALRVDASGPSAEEAWHSTRLRVSTASPLIYEGMVYAVSTNVLKCARVASGDVVWKLRLEGPFSSSPVANGGYLYLFNEDGLGQVVQTGRKGKLVARNDLGEVILATPAISDGALFIRSDAHLWKIASGR